MSTKQNQIVSIILIGLTLFVAFSHGTVTETHTELVHGAETSETSETNGFSNFLDFEDMKWTLNEQKKQIGLYFLFQ